MMKHTFRKITYSSVLLLLSTSQVLAESTFKQEKATVEDWLARMPVIIAATIFTLVMDAVFIVPAIRKLRAIRQQIRRQ